ncbi:MAG: hypothetical protein J7K73_02200 [Nanoarchaeota archaeon]|nr:hypothetical protein [Nanoarchaeota archaeon]
MKSQMSIEFLTGVVIILFIYVITISVFSNYAQTDLLESEIGKQICYRVSLGIDSGVIGGENFALNLTMPYGINGKNYTIYTTPDKALVTVEWDGGIFSCTTTTQNVSEVRFTPCKFSVNNINRTIYLSTLSTNKDVYSIGETVEMRGEDFLTNVTLKIFDKGSNIIYSNTLQTTDSTFTDTWQPNQKGEFRIVATDNYYKTLNAERVIYVV